MGLLCLVIMQAFDVHQPLSLNVLDVGQGDAILIQTPEHRNILVDSGPDSLVVDELGKRLHFFEKTIDLFIITHPHRDHYGGFLDVLQKYRVSGVVMTGVPTGDPVFGAMIDHLKQKGIPLYFPANNEDIQIGPDTFLDFLYPFGGQSLIGQEVHNKNNTSIALRLVRQGEPLAILTGDAEVEEERELVLSGQDVSARILKVGHHGSRTATSQSFLAGVNPSLAVISCGEGNTYEHPHPETLEKLKTIPVGNTMADGNITLKF